MLLTFMGMQLLSEASFSCREEAFPTRYVEGDRLGAGPSASSIPGEDCEPAG